MKALMPLAIIGASAWYFMSLKKTGEKITRCEISSFKLGKLSIGLQQTTIPVELQIFNPNSTDVPADYFRGIVKRAGIKIGDFTFDSLGKSTMIKSRRTTPLTFNVRVSSLGAIRNIVDVFKNLLAARPIDTVFTIEGIIAIGGFDVPVNYKWDVKSNKAVNQVSGIDGLINNESVLWITKGYGKNKNTASLDGKAISLAKANDLVIAGGYVRRAQFDGTRGFNVMYVKSLDEFHYLKN